MALGSFGRRLARISLLAIALMALLGTARPGDATAQDITVKVDEVRLVRLDRPGASVVIGNPSVADVAVQSGRLLAIAGKSFGLTNVIVLDTKGREILDRKLRVATDPSRIVRVYRGAGRRSFDCVSRCETALIPGDDSDYFDNVAKATRSKFGVAQSALEGTPSSQ